MVHYEVVQYLMDCCGITYSQAVQVLRSNDWDLWQAEASIRNNKMRVPKMQKNRPRQQRIHGVWRVSQPGRYVHRDDVYKKQNI